MSRADQRHGDLADDAPSPLALVQRGGPLRVAGAARWHRVCPDPLGMDLVMDPFDICGTNDAEDGAAEDDAAEEDHPAEDFAAEEGEAEDAIEECGGM